MSPTSVFIGPPLEWSNCSQRLYNLGRRADVTAVTRTGSLVLPTSCRYQNMTSEIDGMYRPGQLIYGRKDGTFPGQLPALLRRRDAGWSRRGGAGCCRGGA